MEQALRQDVNDLNALWDSTWSDQKALTMVYLALAVALARCGVAPVNILVSDQDVDHFLGVHIGTDHVRWPATRVRQLNDPLVRVVFFYQELSRLVLTLAPRYTTEMDVVLQRLTNHESSRAILPVGKSRVRGYTQ